MSKEQELVARLLRAAVEDAPASGAKERALDAVASHAAEAVAARAAPAPISQASPWLSHAIGGAATLALAAAVALVAYLPGGGASKHVAAASVAPSSDVDAPRATPRKKVAGVVPQRVTPRGAASVTSCEGVSAPDGTASLCSIDGAPMLLDLTNACADETVDLYWVNYDCDEIFYTQIAPGASHYQSTFTTHPWRVRDHATHRLIKEIGRSKEGVTIPKLEGVQAFVVEDGETSEESKRCSEAGLNAQISIENKRGAPVEVYWVDYGCEEIFKGYVAPGETWHQSTWDAHLFRVRDAATHELVKELSADPAPAARRVAVSIP